MAEIHNIKTKEKTAKPKLPKGAEVLDKETKVEVEEIENGFLITKRCEVKYKTPGKDYHDWLNYEKKYYSETNPIEITTTDKSLADMFED